MAACPDFSKNEKPSDCPWAEMTRQIVADDSSCESVFKKQTPYLLKQLKKDRLGEEFIELWGQSKNFDENAKAEIVDKKVLNCLAEKLKISHPIQPQQGFDTVHAGLQHTYAYLFSNLITPYGYKRERWTGNDLRRGIFSVENDTLTPMTKKGSFLANVTYLFAKLTFGADNLKDKKNIVSKEIKNLDLTKINFEKRHLKESPTGLGIILHTVFVKLDKQKFESKNTRLLIYWYEDIAAKKNFLISGFPVEESFMSKAFDEKNLGIDKPISSRYNAWIAGLTDAKAPLVGKREEVK